MAYEIVWETKGVIKRFVGPATDMEVAVATIKVEGNEAFDRVRYVINDFTDCTSFSTSPKVIEEIAAGDSGAALTNRNIRIAIVATLPAVVAAAKQYADSAIHPYPTRIVATMDEARAWLAGTQ